jgi:hypothetical protein
METPVIIEDSVTMLLLFIKILQVVRFYHKLLSLQVGIFRFFLEFESSNMGLRIMVFALRCVESVVIRIVCLLLLDTFIFLPEEHLS